MTFQQSVQLTNPFAQMTFYKLCISGHRPVLCILLNMNLHSFLLIRPILLSKFLLQNSSLFLQLLIELLLSFIISQFMISSQIKYSIVLLALVSASVYLAFADFEQSSVSDFEMWKNKFGVKYDSEFENSYRLKIFIDKKIIIDRHNKDQTQTYKKGLNKFSAMTQQEFRKIYLNLQAQTPIKPANLENFDNLTAASVDWRKQGAVGPIKDQGHCGSCWSFSVTGGLEGISKVFYGNLQIFSEQQLIDCVSDNHGCQGGQMRRGINYVKTNGIVLESEYPYKAVQGSCLKPTGSFKVSGYTDITNCGDLANALTTRPITIGIDADGWSDYQSGIYNGCRKQKGVYNHGVLLVGMTNDYWIVKNQWTAQWGEDGYMRLARGDTCNICGDGMVIQK